LAVRSGGAAVVDARPAFQFALGHIPGAINIPYDRELLSQVMQEYSLRRRKVIVYCSSARCGAAELWVAVPAYPADELRISDIELASEIRPARLGDRERGFLKHGLYVKPYPYRTLRRGQPIFLYYEIYGLRPDEAGQVRCRVEYEVEAARKGGLLAFLSALNPFRGKGVRLTSSYDYAAEEPQRHEHLLLELGSLRPGAYRLRLKVLDQVAGSETSSEVRFQVVE